MLIVSYDRKWIIDLCCLQLRVRCVVSDITQAVAVKLYCYHCMKKLFDVGGGGRGAACTLAWSPTCDHLAVASPLRWLIAVHTAAGELFDEVAWDDVAATTDGTLRPTIEVPLPASVLAVWFPCAAARVLYRTQPVLHDAVGQQRGAAGGGLARPKPCPAVCSGQSQCCTAGDGVEGDVAGTPMRAGINNLGNARGKHPTSGVCACMQAQPLTCLAWSRTEQTVAAGTEKGSLVLFQVGRRKREVVQARHAKAITCIAWSTTGLLAVAARDNKVRLQALVIATVPEACTCMHALLKLSHGHQQVTINAGHDGSMLRLLAFKKELQDLQFAPVTAGASGSMHGTVSAVLGRRSIVLARVGVGGEGIYPSELHFRDAYDEIDSYAWCSPDRLVVVFRAGGVFPACHSLTWASVQSLSCHRHAQGPQ